MEIRFTYKRKLDDWSLQNKILKLPDVPFGVLAVEIGEGHYLEIARVFLDEVVVSNAIHSDEEALHEALFEFEENFPRKQFEAQLKDFATTDPAPLEIVAFAGRLAAKLGLDLDKLTKRRDDRQLELKAAE